MFSIASWNVNSVKVRLLQVLTWLQSHPVDVLALQETKTVDAQFPAEAIEEAGYQVLYSGQKTYNGVALLYKGEASDVITAWPNFEDEQKRVLGATMGGIRVFNVYVPNGSEIDSDKYHYKLNWLEACIKTISEALSQHEKVIILGDFNIAPEDRDVHDPKAWEGHVHVSPLERAALQRLMELGLKDCFRLFEPGEGHFSWWDYRAAGFRRNLGLRIDHILASTALVEICQSSIIDKEPRGWERPSDHTPVVATFA